MHRRSGYLNQKANNTLERIMRVRALPSPVQSVGPPVCAHSIRLSHQQKSFATPASSFLYFIEYLSKLFEVGTGQNKNWDGASTRSLQTGRAACKACIAALSLVQSRKAF